MIDKDLQEAYEFLTPKDQMLVDAIIFTLACKDAEQRKLVKQVAEFLDKKNERP